MRPLRVAVLVFIVLVAAVILFGVARAYACVPPFPCGPSPPRRVSY